MDKIVIQKEIINDSLLWANEYSKDSFPINKFKNKRRQLKQIEEALQDKCCVAAYGESQVGKSYLMNSLLSSSKTPFLIENRGEKYSFIDDLNPSGGNNTKVESTGVITRFTIDSKNEGMKDFICIKNFSITDIILMLTDSYYNDVKINTNNTINEERINSVLQEININTNNVNRQFYIDEDNIRDIKDYIHEVIGGSAIIIAQSNFFLELENIISYIPDDKWGKVFGLLWNENVHFVNLFNKLINEYKKINYTTEVYVPFESLLREEGTLLNIQWIDLIKDENIENETLKVKTTNVYDKDGKILYESFKKSFLATFAAEITFVLPQEISKGRAFLKDIDLLDFPGARSRQKTEERNIEEELCLILRRGKVSYLFNKYSRSRKIASILFCHHNDQKSEPSIGGAINNWIEKEIGQTPKERAEKLELTQGLSPLFFIATKFNIDLAPQKSDKPNSLSNHWSRFNTVIPEMIPEQWFNNWVEKGEGYQSEYFQNIFLLRDFYWSGEGPSKSNLFSGYDESSESAEEKYIYPKGYSSYYDDLKESFLNNDFVKKHFLDPSKSWEDVVSLNKDGSGAIIDALGKIAPYLNKAREQDYENISKEINKLIINDLNHYFVSDDEGERNQELRKFIKQINSKLTVSVGKNNEVFGNIISALMIKPEKFRNIVRNIIILRRETPRCSNSITTIRIDAKIDPSDSRELNVSKLIDYFGFNSEDELNKELEDNYDFTINDIIVGDVNFSASTAHILTEKIMECWKEHLDNSSVIVNQYIPSIGEIIPKLKILSEILNIKDIIVEKIRSYENTFNRNEQLNVIADVASLTLNDFISTVGRKFMKENDIDNIKERSEICNLQVELSDHNLNIDIKPISITEALQALEDSTKIIQEGIHTLENNEILLKNPFWYNFYRWKNFLSIGIILASEVSNVNPEENNRIKEILNRCQQLYS